MVCLEDEIKRLGLRKAETYFDFIEVKIYTHPDRYEVKDMSYWMWSPNLKRLDERKMYEMVDGERVMVRQWRSLRRYIDLIYIKDD